MDIDIFLQHSIAELFKLKQMAFTAHSYSTNLPHFNEINNGFMVIRPSEFYYDKLVSYGQYHLQLYNNNDTKSEWPLITRSQLYMMHALQIGNFNKSDHPNTGNHDNFVMLSYIYNQIVAWCHLVPNLDHIKVWHSCADREGFKFWKSLKWDKIRGIYGFQSLLVRKAPVNIGVGMFPDADKNLLKTIEQNIRQCRYTIYDRWYRHFNKIQKYILQVVNELQQQTMNFTK